MAERSYRWYTSREQCKTAYLEMASTVTEKDNKIDALIESASRWIEEAVGSFFYPVTATRYYDHPWDDSVLKLDQWLLGVTTFTTSNGDETISSGDYFLMCGDTYNIPPYDRIVMKSDGNRPNLLYSGTPQKANTITGAWGYCNDYENTGTTLGAAITSTTATTFTSSSGSSLETGWMLLIDSEQLYISGISSNTITVKRGMNGTTAATHANAAIVYRYVPPHDIEALCGILVARLFHRGSTAWSDITGSEARGLLLPRQLTRLYLMALPAEAHLVIQRYKRRW